MSPTAVTCRNVGAGVAALPIVLFTLTTFARLNRLNASSISSTAPPPTVIARDTRTSNDAVPHVSATFEKHGMRALLRPTPAGLSLTVVSLLLSAPVTTLNGNGDAYAYTHPI